MKHINYCEFTADSLEAVLVESVIEEYAKAGGKDLAVKCVNYENKCIDFDVSNMFSEINIKSIIACMRENDIASFELIKDQSRLQGVSFDGGKEWVLGIGDNPDFIVELLEKLWYSVFEL